MEILMQPLQELEPIVTMDYEPTREWRPERTADPVAAEQTLNTREARRILDIFYDVNREFTHIELGLL